MGGTKEDKYSIYSLICRQYLLSKWYSRTIHRPREVKSRGRGWWKQWISLEGKSKIDFIGALGTVGDRNGKIRLGGRGRMG